MRQREKEVRYEIEANLIDPKDESANESITYNVDATSMDDALRRFLTLLKCPEALISITSITVE
jgi:hypothetical protein